MFPPPGPVHRGGDIRGYPAPGGHEGQQGDRRHQQGPRGTHLPGLRLWTGTGPLQGTNTGYTIHRSMRLLC